MARFKIWITGSNGQLGSELSALAKNVSEAAFIYTDVGELDITDLDQVRNFVVEQQPDFLINCAAYTAVDRAEEDAYTAFRVNAYGPRNLALACHEASVRMIHLSTDYVFDGKSTCPYTEESRVNPQSVYGHSKLEGEREVLVNDANAIIIRTAWLYSSYGSNFVKTMLRLASERDSVRVVADQCGTPTYARDLAEAILLVVKKTAANPGFWTPGLYHYSNEGVCTWYDFAMAIMEEAGLSCAVIPVATAEFPVIANRPAYSVLSKSKFCNTFGFDVPHWRSSLRECLHLITK